MAPSVHNQKTRNLDKYERPAGLEAWLLERFRRRLVHLAGAVGASAVLDAGCGEGIATGWLAAALPFADISGVDARPDAIAQAGCRVPAARLQVGDLYALPYEDRAFDLVVSTEVLEHVERPADALRELSRVSRGHLLLTVPCEPVFRGGNLLRRRYARRLGSTPGHVNTWGPRAFAKAVSQHASILRRVEMLPWQGILATTAR